MAQTHPIASHPNTVAEYRIHGANISLDNRDMRRWTLKVYERQKSFALARSGTAKAWHHGRSRWRDYYSQQTLVSAKRAWMQSSHKLRDVSGLLKAMLMSPRPAARMAMRAVQRRLIDVVPSGVGYGRGHVRSAPALGRVRFGDLDRSHPIDNDYGFGRGTPIDRGYIEDFLSHHAKDIRGRVLEVGDDAYSRRFGGGRITHQDILHIDPSVTWATIVGDLAKPGVLPTAAFDCMIITQTLHLIYDMVSAVREIHRALRPDGVVLLTVPGISPIDRGEWRDSWYWSLTEVSARRLFNNVFGADHVEVETQGNVFAATAFLYGLALEEVPRGKLSTKDLAFPVIVSVRAQKASES
jgi:SAM-dependent methyltransferase